MKTNKKPIDNHIDRFLLHEKNIEKAKLKISSNIKNFDIDKKKLAKEWSDLLEASKRKVREEYSDIISVERLQKIGERIGNEIKDIDKQNRKFRNNSDNISNRIISEIKKIKNQADFKWESILVLSFSFIIVASTVNTLIMSLGASFLGPMGGMVLAAVVSAPLIEEFFKKVSAEQNVGYFVTAIFSIYEMVQYLMMGVPFLSRIPALFMHFVTLAIQNFFKTEDFQGDSKISNLGYILAVLAHATFNASMVFIIM